MKNLLIHKQQEATLSQKDMNSMSYITNKEGNDKVVCRGGKKKPSIFKTENLF